MALLNILKYPHENLRKKADKVVIFDDDLKDIVNNMFETMYDAKGIGLAATQVDIHKQIITMDLSEDRKEPKVFINATLNIIDDILVEYREGCLSLPDIYDNVCRSKIVEITYFDLNGNKKKEIAEGLLAVCIQHEIDHLNGKLFIDYLSSLKRMRIKTKMQKYQKENKK